MVARPAPRIYARTAGFLYLIVIVTGVPTGIALDLMALSCGLPLILVLYELLKVVNQRQCARVFAATRELHA